MVVLVEVVVVVVGETTHAVIKWPIRWHTKRMITTPKVAKENCMALRIEEQ